MCNLSGYVGRTPPNNNILQLLMILGRDRGKDSCGIMINNKRTLGYTDYTEKVDTADSIDFVKSFTFPEVEDNNNVMIHNRAPSFGAGRGNNAIHPFKYTDDETGASLYFMHNGTIHNTTELAAHFNIDYVDYVSDTDLMGQILFFKGIDAFEEALKMYEGFANFVWCWSDEPNIMHIWKGGSYKEESGKNIMYHERPLHFVSTKKNLYFSSLKEQLETVFHGNCKPVQFKCNHITVLNSKKKVETFKIDRNQPFWVKHKPYSRTTYTNTTNLIFPKGFNYKPQDCNNLAKGGIYWKEGYYYQHGQKVHGIRHFNDKGVIVHSSSKKIKETLYFFYGFWITNKTGYESTLRLYNKNISHKPVNSLFHADSVHVGAYVNDIYVGKRIWKTKFGTKFSKRFMMKYYTIGNGKFTGETSLIVANNQLNKLLSNSSTLSHDKMVINFNIKHHTEFGTRTQCNTFFRQLYKTDNTVIPLDLTDENVLDYNYNHKTSFTTKKECNTHYYLNNETYYNTHWPIDENIIIEHSLNLNKTF